MNELSALSPFKQQITHREIDAEPKSRHRCHIYDCFTQAFINHLIQGHYTCNQEHSYLGNGELRYLFILLYKAPFSSSNQVHSRPGYLKDPQPCQTCDWLKLKNCLLVLKHNTGELSLYSYYHINAWS